MKFLRYIVSLMNNNRTLSKNIIGVVFLKGISLILAFVTTPMYLSYFQDQNILGVWYTLQSILLWILTFDLGLGSGVRNRLAKSISLGDTEDARKTVSSGYLVLGIVTLLLSGLLTLLVPFVNWQSTLNTTIENRTLSYVIYITLIGILLQFFFKIVTSVLMALRKNILANSLPLFTNALIFVYLIMPHSGSDNALFVNLALFYTCATLLPLFLATVYLFIGPLKNIRPSLRYWDSGVAKAVITVGGSFFAIQIGLLIVNSTNQIIINYLYSGENVVTYTIYYRLYSMAPMIFTLFTQPIWSEISVKYAKGQYDWIGRIYHFTLFTALFFSLGCLLVSWILPWIFEIWLGPANTVPASRMLGLIFAVWNIVELFIYASTCIANGMSDLKCQFVFTMVAAVAKIPVTLLLYKIYDNWITVIIAHTLVILPLMIAQNVTLVKKLKAR